MKRELVFSVVGARPHFVKAAPFMEAMKDSNMDVHTIHTGQHYDQNMSDVFFRELNLPKPDVNLGIGSGTHAQQTSAVMMGVEPLLFDLKPSAVVVYGDTNTTLGAALAAAKYYIPVIHVEAGVRCGNFKMPEEINRRLIDRLSSFLACPSDLAVNNLRLEGMVDGVHNVGDFMYDTFLKARDMALNSNFDLDKYSVEPGNYIISTLHREETTASVEILCDVLDTLGGLGIPVLLPMHPRTRACLEQAGVSLERKDGLQIIPPVGYLEMVYLLNHAKLALTDSGGVQKEAYWAGVPCVTLMNETTWTETVDEGWNILTGLSSDNIGKACDNFLNHSSLEQSKNNLPELYGAPGAARRMVEALGWI